MSPRRKKAKRSPRKNNIKRENNAEEVTCKRPKVVKTEEDELKARKKKNFVEACRQVSYNAYSNYRVGLLYYVPSCTKKRLCKHNDSTGINKIKEMPHYTEESFTIEMKNNMWYDALEVCQMCITPVQYLSANVLKEVVEIILNVHEDDLSEHTVPHIIDKCQQILSQNFSTHPPCIKSLKSCYKSFLLSAMDDKEKTYTNRLQYECKSGIVKYCMNRLENEISSDSQDGPLINKCENIPEKMKQSLKGLHWQKEKFEIFELLNRPDRIERLMAVLESIVELLQFDLIIWQSRHPNNAEIHITRSNKPLMAFVLWGDKRMISGSVTANCRQIITLFVHLIHLQYPESMIRIITTWLNTVIQTIYLCEENSNSDYPNTSFYGTRFAKVFYNIISEVPRESINRILERIEPAYMRHLIGMLHIQKLTKTNNDCIISILTNNIKELKSEIYPPEDTEKIEISKKLFSKPKKIKRIINYVIQNCMTPESDEEIQYAKLDKKELKYQLLSTTDYFSLSHIVHTQYTTLEAYLDTYDVQSVNATWNKLNEQMSDDSQRQTQTLPESSSYYVTEELIKKYRHIMQTIKELQVVFHDLKTSGNLPEMFEIFTNIELLEQ